MNKNTSIAVSIFLGIVFLIVAIVYWMTPAGSLPTFMPGYEAGVTAVHLKHAIASLVLSLGIFAYAWFRGGPRKDTPPLADPEHN